MKQARQETATMMDGNKKPIWRFPKLDVFMDEPIKEADQAMQDIEKLVNPKGE